MRILHVAESFATGTMEVVNTLSERLADEGHEVAVAYGRRPETPEDLSTVVDERVDLFETPWTDRSPSAHAKTVPALRRIVKDYRPDVVHLHSSFAGFTGAAALAGTKVRTVYTPHGYSFARDASATVKRACVALERFTAGQVTMVGAVSDDEGRLAREVAKARRVEVVPNGIRELDAPDLREDQGELPRVMALGRIAPQRQPEKVAAILSALSDIAEVEWVGGADDPARETPLRTLDVPVSGWLTREQALERLAASSVYLHWTAWDGHPLSILEAMARDTMVIASAIGPNREILGDDQVFDDELQAIGAIRRALTDRAERRRLLVAQRKRRELFSAQRMTSRWLDVYETVA